MTDSSLLLCLLGLISGCLLVLTLVSLHLATTLSRTLHYLNRLLPDANETVRDVGRVARRAEGVVTRLESATHALEGVVRRGCGMATEALDGMASLTQRARKALSERFGMENGSREEPRRHRRGRSVN